MTDERKGPLWAIEIVMTGLITLGLLPMSCLYLMDFSAGTISPDAEWALAGAVGLAGLWLALLRPNSFFMAHSALRWVVVATLIVAIATLSGLAWETAGGSGLALGVLLLVGPIGVAMHQLVRLLRLGFPARSH